MCTETVTTTFATLRSLHNIIGDALDYIENVFRHASAAADPLDALHSPISPSPSPLSPYSTNPGATPLSPYSHYVPTTALRLRWARALRARDNHSPCTRSVETQRHFGPRGRCKYRRSLQGGRVEAPQGGGDSLRARIGEYQPCIPVSSAITREPTATTSTQGKCRLCKRSRQIQHEHRRPQVHRAKTQHGRSVTDEQTPCAEHGHTRGDGTHADCECTGRMPSTQARPTNGPHAREQKTGDGNIGEGWGARNTRRLRAWRADAYHALTNTHAGGRAHAGDDDTHGDDERAGRMPSTQTRSTNGMRVRDGRTGEGTWRTGQRWAGPGGGKNGRAQGGVSGEGRNG